MRKKRFTKKAKIKIRHKRQKNNRTEITGVYVCGEDYRCSIKHKGKVYGSPIFTSLLDAACYRLAMEQCLEFDTVRIVNSDAKAYVEKHLYLKDNIKMAKKKINGANVQEMACLLDIYAIGNGEMISLSVDDVVMPELTKQGLIDNGKVTEKGKVYIKTLLKVKLPVQKWV